MALAVLAGVIPSANLDSSSSLAKAKRLEDVDGCGSLAIEGGWSNKSHSGSGIEVATSALPGQSVQEHMPRQAGSNGQANSSVVKSKLAMVSMMATTLLYRTVVAMVPEKRSALRSADFQPIRWDI